MKKLLSLLLTIVMAVCLVNLNSNLTKAVKDEFYAVYDTTGGANTLTFYYDTNKDDRTGDKYPDLPTTAASYTDWGYDGIRTNILNVIIDSSVKNYKELKSTAYMFYMMYNATNITGCENLDVSNVTNMKSMFFMYGGYSGNNISAVPNVSGWKTSNVTNMASMFASYGNQSTAITSAPDVSKWNTSKVTDMSSMFSGYGASSTTITAVPDVSGWDTSKVTTMNQMFITYAASSVSKLNSLDLSKWNIDALTDTFGMFYGYARSNIEGDPIVYGTDWSSKKTIAGTGSGSMFNDSKLKGDKTANWGSANTSDTGCFTAKPVVIEEPSNSPVDESCEKVIGPTWHWNNELGVCEEYALVRTFTR